MRAKEFEPKPRNFVAKNAKMGGAGAHKDKKKAEKQGDLKHKKSLVPMESVLRDKEDLQAKRKALQDLSMNKDVDQQAVQQRKLDLEKEAKKQGIAERIRDPEDWDEGNTEPGNNFAVYINGKKWKVFPGPAGAYADSPEEKRELGRLQAMAQRKSQETGKKWQVYVTGEPATK